MYIWPCKYKKKQNKTNKQKNMHVSILAYQRGYICILFIYSYYILISLFIFNRKISHLIKNCCSDLKQSLSESWPMLFPHGYYGITGIWSNLDFSATSKQSYDKCERDSQKTISSQSDENGRTPHPLPLLHTRRVF